MKPTDIVPAPLAVQAAVGQLLWYRHALGIDAALETIGGPADAATISFARAVGVQLWRRSGRSFERLA